MKTLLALADRLDFWEARGRRLAEKWGAPQPWLHELQDFLGEARMLPEEFWALYAMKRREAIPKMSGPLTDTEALAFYRDSDYMLWRNVVHRRHSAWRRVLWTMRGHYGTLWEIGCATAPVSVYCVKRKPDWFYCLHDIDSPHFAYGVWRMKRRVPSMHISVCRPPHADVVTLLDVLEHLPDPLAMAKDAVKALAPGGYLHVNFVGNERRNDLDLATPEQRDETLAYLGATLEMVWEAAHGYSVMRKRR